MKIIIDPRIKYNYATFYLLGLQRLFGNRAIQWDIKPFLHFDYSTKLQYNRGMPIIICGGGDLKIFIDYFDDATFENDRYEWCDVYAKVNPRESDLIKYKKMMAIGPSFGIRVSPLLVTLFLGVSNFCKSRGYTSRNFKQMILDYLYPYVRRLNIANYETDHVITEENYTFHLATLWNGENEKQNINDVRKAYLVACKKCGINLEGGFFYIGDKTDFYQQYLSEYRDYLYYQRLSLKEYINKIRRSFVVFNCPAVAGCIGWKLAEYLMLGKAIITMPINHPLPGGGLKHGVHAHFVNSTEDIPEAILEIKNNKKYRTNLQHNARLYYEEFLAPDKVVNRIVNQCRINRNI